MYRILIADDEKNIRTLLEKNLQNSSLPIEVTASAGNGKEALEMAETYPPDILITDIAMPFMNGLELIETLQARGISTKNIIISGYDEFDYAKKAIGLGVTDYLLKPFMPQELQEVLEKIIRELDGQRALNQNLHMLMEQADQNKLIQRERSLKTVLNGGGITEQEKKLLGLQDYEEDISCLTCVLNLKGIAWDFRIPEKLEEFMQLIKPVCFSEEMKICAASLEANKLIICFLKKTYDEAAFQKEIIHGIERFSKSMKQYYDIVPYCTLGRVYHKYEELRQSYQEALETWQEALNPDKKIRIFGEKKTERILQEEEVKARIKYTKSCIRGAVSNGKETEGIELLQQLMRLYAAISNKGSEYIFISAGELVFGIADDMEKSGCGRPGQMEIPHLKRQAEASSLLELEEVLREYLILCCRQVNEQAAANRSEVAVNMVQEYIEEHLKESTFSIEEAADLVHFSVSYLRQIFKEKTGENFNEYLIRKRMEKAGEFLQKTSMKISDIAENCGYDSQRYFSSSFKKFYGCTPTEFKEITEREHLY